MIRLYSGTPGSGKSLHNAKDVINRSRFGKPVIGNFPCDLSKYPKANYTYVPNYQLTPDYLIKYSQQYFQGKRIREGTLLLVIDECQLMFNSRDWQQKGRDQWLSFFTQHRKYGYDVTLIAQFDRMIDRQIRGVIEYEFVHRKMSNYGFGGKILSLLFGGNTFVVVQMWYPLKLKIGSEFVHAHKKFYSIYDTFGTFQTEAPASAEDGQKTEKTDALPSDPAQLPEDQEPNPPKKRLKLPKVSFPKIHRKKRKARKSHYVGRYESPYPAPLSLKQGGKYNRKFPENRDQFGWRKNVV